jgi:hypothetical protein
MSLAHATPKNRATQRLMLRPIKEQAAMVSGIYNAHSGWRYIVIVLVVIALVRSLIGWLRNGTWSTFDQRLGLFTVAAYDIQVVMGLVLWILQERWTGGNALASWEHPVTMLVVAAIAHITWSRVKKNEEDSGKFRTEFIGFLISGLLLALGVARITYVL